MNNALALSLSNQMVARRNMEVIANNIANMNTTGYKRESTIFEEQIKKVEVQGDIGHRKEDLSFVRDTIGMRDMSDGSIVSTGNPLDVAVSGDGFFAVQAPEGIRYTRNGSFGLDDTGRLVTSGGDPVLDEGGAEIAFAPDEGAITISRDGTISTSLGLRGRLQVASFANPQTLKASGNSLWEATEEPVPSERPSVTQGMLEGSNVNPVVEMVRMMETMRSYQNSTELLNAGEDLSRRAVQKLGEVRA